VRRLVALALVLGGCAAPPLERPSFAATDAGQIAVPLRRDLTLTGTLSLPASGKPASAVVLMHGCSGVSATHRAWATTLHGWGYAALVLDSFGARGVHSVCETGGVTSEERVEDAFAALRTLAAHPGIDAGRVALMGFSHGGGTVLVAAAPLIARRYATPGAPTFRALIAFYPRCEARYPGTPLPAPLRIHIGALDNWTPAAPCETLTAMLQRAGADARIAVYPDAHHGFDSTRQGPLIRLPNVSVYGTRRRGATWGPIPWRRSAPATTCGANWRRFSGLRSGMPPAALCSDGQRPSAVSPRARPGRTGGAAAGAPTPHPTRGPGRRRPGAGPRRGRDRLLAAPAERGLHR
jgi:dienelactone hydrolase